MNAFITRVFLVLTSFTAVALGNLQFETTRLDHDAPSGESAFVAKFPFRNAGDEAVTIAKVTSSCGCTVPTLEKRVYAPGESGTIEAVFTYGGRSGKQLKHISVETDKESTQLSIYVDIPLRWQINRRLIQWNAGNADKRQTLYVDFFEGQPLAVEVIEINQQRFDVKTDWSEDGTRLTLDIGVQQLDPAGTHRIELVVRNAAEERIRIPFYIRLQG
jgi:hypothetical protein